MPTHKWWGTLCTVNSCHENENFLENDKCAFSPQHSLQIHKIVYAGQWLHTWWSFCHNMTLFFYIFPLIWGNLRSFWLWYISGFKGVGYPVVALLIENASTLKHVLWYSFKVKLGATGTKHFKIILKQEAIWYHPNIIRIFEPNILQAPQIDLFHNTVLGTPLNFIEISNHHIFRMDLVTLFAISEF